ncbi:MAG TPA: hypothetical protein VHF22_12730, partial [Planctomycetota bacterium]|nr:hypothetical protein [Planctomycetota bacterium]
MRRTVPFSALGASLVASAGFFTALAGTSGAAVITFDDLGVAGGGRVTVNAQYSAQGVTFNDVTAIDYAPPSFAPGFAHSGTVGVEQCFAAEFCSAPIVATFTTGQQRVRLWVGASFPLAQPLGVQLTAFDAGHSALGSASVTLPASTSPTPISQPLEVTAPNGRIRSVELSVPGGYTGGVAVDDLEFTAAGPAPPCPATSVPAIELVGPAKGLVVQTNEFLLQGSVTTGGAPIQSASIVARGQGQRTATLYPSLVDADGGTFGPIRFNGLLAPGENRIVVTATNCRGAGTKGEVDVTWNPIPPGASFRLLGLEVTQGIQSASNTVPLVAATGTSSKRTFVRVYLGLSGATGVTHVSGTLTASRPDGSLPGGPPTIPSLNSITVDASTTLETARSSLATSLNFELPREWLTAGLLHLQLDHLDIEGARSTL